jgi:hypothetical protein
MKRLAIVMFAVGLTLTACGNKGPVDVGPIGSGGSPSPTTSPTGTPKPPTSPPPSTGGGTVTYQVWFHYGEHLFVTKRTQQATVAVGKASLTALLEGPSERESAAGVGTSIPAGTRLLGLDIAGGVATVDLSHEFESGGGTLSMSMRLAQVVYTITQFPTVHSVQFRLDGEPVTVFSGEGIVLDHPVARDDYKDLLPAILVESPLIGQTVSSPVTVSGTADVFEATVSIRILDEDGATIKETFATATCGTGCRGTYSVTVSYTVDHVQQGTVVVFEASAKDGSPTNVINIPVELTA